MDAPCVLPSLGAPDPEARQHYLKGHYGSAVLGALLTAAVLAGLTPQQKAGLVVISGLPAAPLAGGVIVRQWDRDDPRPPDALVFADQEGGTVKTFPSIAPWTAAAAIRSRREAFAAGVQTANGLHTVGADVDLGPVLDLPDGPLGSRQFRSPLFGVAFAQGLVAGGAAPCVKHFPGLGPLPISTDERLYVRGLLRDADLSPYRAAVEAGVPCVMVGHGIYANVGRRRAVLEPSAYRLLRGLGFRGVAITDSLGVLGSEMAPLWALEAVRAGADLVLFPKAADAARAIHALVPLARRGELDTHVVRVLAFRARYGRG
jgi:beta-N-acetylhexosaminidase